MEILRIIDKEGQELIFGKSRPFLLEEVSGIGVTSNISTMSGAFDGATITGINIKEKTIAITGAIVGGSKREMQVYRAKLVGFLNPNKGDFDFVYKIDGHTKKITASIQRIDFKEAVTRLQKFQIQVLANFPFWQQENEKRKEIALWTKDAYFPLVATKEKPIVFGHRVSNLICNIFNEGDVETGMRIQLKALATVVNPSVLNIYTHQFIKIMQTLEKGDMLEITTYINNKRIVMHKADGTTKNVLNWMTLDSDFLQLAVGDNTFRYDAESGIDNIEMTIYHNPATLGV